MKWILLLSLVLVQTIFSQQVVSSEKKGRNLSDSNELNSTIAELYKIGNKRFEDRDYVTALPYFLQIDSLSKKYNLENEATVRALLDRSEISRVTFTYEGVELAKDLKLEALAMAERIESDELINAAYVHLADIYGMVDDLPKAKYYTDKAFEYYTTIEDIEKITRLYLIYMNYYLAVENLDSAEIKLREGINYLKDKDHPKQLAQLQVFLGNYWKKYRNNSKKALPLFEASREIYQQLEDTVHLHYLYVLEGLGNCNADLKNYKEAYRYYQLAYEAGKAHEKEKNTAFTRNLEAKYQSEKQQKEIELLSIKNSLAEKEKANQQVLLVAIILIALLIAIVFYMLHKSRQKVTKKLRQLNEMKSVFFANISHEFRTPLTLIKIPVERQLASQDINSIHKEQLTNVKRNTDRLLVLVDQLLKLSKLEANSQRLNISLIQLRSWFKACTESFKYTANQKDITFNTQLDFLNEEVSFDPEVLQQIMSNLLTNAIKYTHVGGAISFGAKLKSDQLIITIENNGEIIRSENHTKVFNRFYQLKPQTDGAGIGLALVKELVELHHGSIQLTTTDTSNIFTVRIPVSGKFYQKSAINESGLHDVRSYNGEQNDRSGQNNANGPQVLIGEEEPGEPKILLVVEDNAEIRSLIRQQFDSDYIVEEAINGREGIKKAKSIVPDIVISDVMMPEIDGIELTRQLKSDEITCHIPIILLTAKAGEENELIGLENEADDYVLKPFSSEKLAIRVQNLIAIRKKLKEKFMQQLVLKPKKIVLGNHDKVFFEKVQLLLDEQLTSNEFTAEYFSNAMEMSRMQLHRKLKALVGLSTSEFIKNQRIKLAYDLIKNGQDNVSEIAYAVGFNDPSYFSRCFKEVYGRAPSEYAVQNSKVL